MNWAGVMGQRGREGGARAGDRGAKSHGWLGTGSPAREPHGHAMGAAAAMGSMQDPEGKPVLRLRRPGAEAQPSAMGNMTWQGKTQVEQTPENRKGWFLRSMALS